MGNHGGESGTGNRPPAGASRAGAMARRAAGSASGAAVPKAPSPPKQTAAQRRAAEVAARHARAIAWQQLNGAMEAKPGAELTATTLQPGLRINPFDHGEAQLRNMVATYGERQLGLALAGASHADLKEYAASIGVKPGPNADETRSRIVAAMTQGRYSANFSTAKARASGAAGGKSGRPGGAKAGGAKAGGAKAGAARATARLDAASELRPVATLDRGTMRAWGMASGQGLGRAPNPYFLHAVYGAGQLRAALAGTSRADLLQAARLVQHFNPGATIKGAGTARGPSAAALTNFIATMVTANPITTPFDASTIDLSGS